MRTSFAHWRLFGEQIALFGSGESALRAQGRADYRSEHCLGTRFAVPIPGSKAVNRRAVACDLPMAIGFLRYDI